MDTHAPAGNPRIWLLCGRKAGDNGQLEAVAAAVERSRVCSVERVDLDFVGHELLVTLLLGPSLRGLKAPLRARIAPPWPDVVLSAGRRNEPVARWIGRASGGRTRVVHVGRPWADPRRYDLVVTSPQYFLEPGRHGNVLTLPLPPVATPRSAPGTGPLLLLLGGDSGSKQVDAGFVLHTLEAAQALARRRHTALRVTTSPRTPLAAEAAAAERSAALGAEFHGWHDAGDAPNPYREWLADAGGVVVTADSMSMIAEAAALAVPLWIAQLPPPARPWWLTRRGWRWRAATHELAQRLAPPRYRRDTQRLLEALVEGGRAAWLEDGTTAPTPAPAAGPTDAERAAAAVAALLPGA
jgi:mitochondrial fission protein ELM1